MIPSPLSAPLKLAGTITKLTGHGRRHKRRTIRRRRVGGRRRVRRMRRGRGLMTPLQRLTDPL
jgi:hypothetical protein